MKNMPMDDKEQPKMSVPKDAFPEPLKVGEMLHVLGEDDSSYHLEKESAEVEEGSEADENPQTMPLDKLKKKMTEQFGSEE